MTPRALASWRAAVVMRHHLPVPSRVAAAEWTSAQINDLPDSAFLYIEPGGEKDEDGKTTPRSLRHFPVYGPDGALDLPHVRNALARIPQSTISQAAKDAARAKARDLLDEATSAADRRLAEVDAPDYREGAEGRRCLDCVYGEQVWGDAVESIGSAQCRLYAFGTLAGYKPWFVCDSYRSRAAQVMYSERPVHLAQVGDREDDGSIWLEVVRAGTFHAGHAGGSAASGQASITFSADDLDSLQRGTEAVLADGRYPTGIPIRLDPDHSDATGPAIGRIKAVRVADRADGTRTLLARVAWTDAGRRTVSDGEYDSVSIEAHPPGALQHKSTGEPIDDWALTGLVVTNHPFVSGLAPLAASDTTQTERDMDLTLITKQLALSDDADEGAVLAAVHDLVERATKADALAESVATLTEDRDALKAELAELAEWKTKRMLDDACAAGRIDASERDLYQRTVTSLGEKDAHRVFPEGRVTTAPRADGGGAGANAPGGTAQDRFEAARAAHIRAGKSAAEAHTLAMAEHATEIAAEYAAERAN